MFSVQAVLCTGNSQPVFRTTHVACCWCFDHMLPLLPLLLLLLQVWRDGDGSVHGGGAQAQAGSSWQQKLIRSASCSSEAGSRSLSWQAAFALVHSCWRGCTAKLAQQRC
jgi:hypothetical protein